MINADYKHLLEAAYAGKQLQYFLGEWHDYGNADFIEYFFEGSLVEASKFRVKPEIITTKGGHVIPMPQQRGAYFVEVRTGSGRAGDTTITGYFHATRENAEKHYQILVDITNGK